MPTPGRPRARVANWTANSPATTADTRTALVLATLGGSLAVLVQLDWRPLLTLDGHVARVLHESALNHPGWTGTARVLTDWVWDTWTMRALLAGSVLWLWWRSQRAPALRVLTLTVAGALLQQLLKAALGRERPQWVDPVDSAHYAAMPSGHAMTTALACGLLIGVIRAHRPRRWVWWLASVAAAISMVGVSWTRVYLGVHWLTDVVVGSLLGLALAMWPARSVRTGATAVPVARRRAGRSPRPEREG